LRTSIGSRVLMKNVPCRGKVSFTLMIEIPINNGIAYRVDCGDCGKTIMYVTLGSDSIASDNICEPCHRARYFPNKGKGND
jgi:hypothetical protein